MANTYTLISSYTASTSPTSFTFTSIPQTYTDLKLVMSLRGSRAAFYSNISVLVNGSSSAIYDYKWVYSSSGTITNNGYTGDTELGQFINGANSTANTFGSLEMYFTNYTSSNNKSISVDNVVEDNSTSTFVVLEAELARTSSPITSFTITGSGNNYTFANNSTAYLYGIKNS